MMNLEKTILANSQVDDFKINIHEKKSYELFFVKGALETVRSTKTCDTEVTVYSRHDDCMGDAQFLVYPSTTEEQLKKLIEEAVEKAKLINNKPYQLPANESGEYTVASNFADFRPEELAAQISNTVFDANTIENASLNSVEIFVNQHTETIINSRGIRKTQVRYDAMVEAIPTYNGETQSVELYEQYNFGSLDRDALNREIAEMMLAVKARYEAKKPEAEISCGIILNRLELAELFRNIAGNLQYSSVYTKSGFFHKGDQVQKNPTGDRITITMAGEAEGNMNSAKFDNDGMSLKSIEIVKNGQAVNYFGGNRYGQYLGEVPTGILRCILVDAGTVSPAELKSGDYLEVISMSGLQVDFFNDYIGGEVRLAYLHEGEKMTPITGISVSGSMSEVLNQIRFSEEKAVCGGYNGPAKAVVTGMKVF